MCIESKGTTAKLVFVVSLHIIVLALAASVLAFVRFLRSPFIQANEELQGRGSTFFYLILGGTMSSLATSFLGLTLYCTKNIYGSVRCVGVLATFSWVICIFCGIVLTIFTSVERQSVMVTCDQQTHHIMEGSQTTFSSSREKKDETAEVINN